MNFIIRDNVTLDQEAAKHVLTHNTNAREDYGTVGDCSITLNSKKITNIMDYMETVDAKESFGSVPYVDCSGNNKGNNFRAESFNIYADIYNTHNLNLDNLIDSCMEPLAIFSKDSEYGVSKFAADLTNERLSLVAENGHVLFKNRIKFLSNYITNTIINTMSDSLYCTLCSLNSDENKEFTAENVENFIKEFNHNDRTSTFIMSRINSIILQTLYNMIGSTITNTDNIDNIDIYIYNKKNLAVEDMTMKTGISYVMNVTNESISELCRKYYSFNSANIFAQINEGFYMVYSAFIPTVITNCYYQLVCEYYAIFSKFFTDNYGFNATVSLPNDTAPVAAPNTTEEEIPVLKKRGRKKKLETEF